MFTSTKKRMREEDEELEKFRHDCKRSRMLPFRVSPISKHTRLFSQRTRSIPIPQTLTPDLSDSDISPTSPTNTSIRSPPYYPSQTNATSPSAIENGLLDTDLDMADSHSTITLPQRPPHHPSGNRVPTPIYTHFPLRLPANKNDITMTNDIDIDIDNDDLDSLAPSSQTNQYELDHDLLLLRRRLPSPISESDDESMVSPTSGAGGMLGRLNVHHIADPGEEDEGIGEGRASGGMNVENQQHDNHHKVAVSKAGWGTPKDTIAGEAGRKVGKTILVMGYRADCEKCRTRVPGHWSHFIRA
ncbi:MAG: hypothetical protein M1830_005566 [Pleopsidium flavum]|nr:MAG: hypothetical protein M1830_005566 [Pleopsidium flavum]